jgi:hypothetical protein
MNKKTLFMLLVTLFVMTSMFATQARMSGLGNPYGLIEDDTDVFIYPATIFNYSGAVAELQQGTGSANWNMSANIPILNYKLGVYLNRDTMLDLPGYGLNLDLGKSVEFNFGFMDKFAIGFGTSADYRSEVEIGDFKKEPSASYFSFFGGYSDKGMDAGLRLEMANAEDVDVEGADEFIQMSYTALDIRGRQYIINEDNMSLMVQAGYMMKMEEYNYENLVGDKLEDKEISQSMLDIGFGLQVKAGQRSKIIFGLTPIIYNPISFEYTTYNNDDKITTKHDDTWMFFPEYNLAVESQICSWLTGRVGANQVYAHVTQEVDYDETMAQEDTEENYYSKDFYMNLGLTFSFGNFCIDSVLEQELLFEGPDFIGGNANGLATEISVKYKF